jgi:dipeptidyl aminopeptidase/acylaminoacyl peptidase
VSHPELSPDGTQLAYVSIPFEGRNTDIEFKLGRIYVRSYDQANQTFGSERPLVADGQNNFSPSWSPDGAWIAFNKVIADSFNYDDSSSATWAVKADGSQPPIALARANQAAGLTNSSVRWTPFAQTLGEAKEPMFWLTMSSKRDFGVTLRNTGKAQRGSTGKRAQLWMTPFFPARAAQGTDPSVPAFRLPFQNLDSSNHIAQWTERVVIIE